MNNNVKYVLHFEIGKTKIANVREFDTYSQAVEQAEIYKENGYKLIKLEKVETLNIF